VNVGERERSLSDFVRSELGGAKDEKKKQGGKVGGKSCTWVEGPVDPSVSV